MANLGKLIKQADAAAESASRLVLRAMREIRGELALLADELNLTGSAADRDKVYQMIQKKMARLSRRLDALMDAQNHLAGKTAAKNAEEMTGLEVKYSAARANAIIELVTPAQGENLAAVFTQNMAQRSINALQEATVAVMREQAVEGGTLKEMGKALGKKWTDALKAPPVFTDAGGNTWDTKTYLQMNIRTNTMRVYNDCLVDDIARSTGEDFVRVSRGGDPMCKLCAPWEGVILSISGKAKGFPSYEQARAAGCFHPNCVHTLEYTDEVADEEEFEIQRKFPATEKEATDPDAMDERRYKIDQERYRRKGLTKDAARIAVDRDNLTDNIRHGLVRADAREIVDKLTDAQITALCKDGNPPRFTPTKKATKKDPHTADEKFIRGKRGGVVHISRNAGVEDIIRVTRLEDKSGIVSTIVTKIKNAVTNNKAKHKNHPVPEEEQREKDIQTITNRFDLSDLTFTQYVSSGLIHVKRTAQTVHYGLTEKDKEVFKDIPAKVASSFAAHVESFSATRGGSDCDAFGGKIRIGASAWSRHRMTFFHESGHAVLNGFNKNKETRIYEIRLPDPKKGEKGKYPRAFFTDKGNDLFDAVKNDVKAFCEKLSDKKKRRYQRGKLIETNEPEYSSVELDKICQVIIGPQAKYNTLSLDEKHLVGSITDTMQAATNSAFNKGAGHEVSYYEKSLENRLHEPFANITALITENSELSRRALAAFPTFAAKVAKDFYDIKLGELPKLNFPPLDDNNKK